MPTFKQRFNQLFNRTDNSEINNLIEESNNLLINLMNKFTVSDGGSLIAIDRQQLKQELMVLDELNTRINSLKENSNMTIDNQHYVFYNASDFCTGLLDLVTNAENGNFLLPGTLNLNVGLADDTVQLGVYKSADYSEQGSVEAEVLSTKTGNNYRTLQQDAYQKDKSIMEGFKENYLMAQPEPPTFKPF